MVKIVVTDDPKFNCGMRSSRAAGGGCFNTETPNTIYISSRLTEKQVELAAYHEYHHLLMNSQGKPLEECAADKFAVEHGANDIFSAYSEDCQKGIELKHPEG